METSVLKEMVDKEILDLLQEERDSLIKMKMSHAVSPLENPQKIKFTRRNIARIMTEISRREKLKDN